MLQVAVIAGVLIIGGMLIRRAVVSFTISPENLLPVQKTTAPRPPAVPGTEIRHVMIQPGETFVAALGRLGFSPGKAHSTAMDLSDMHPVEKVHPGRRLSVTFVRERPLRLEYEINDASRLLAQWQKNGRINASVHTQPFETRIAFVRGEITSSLFAGILKAGEEASLADLLASLFEYDVDFNRDIRVGDTFQLLVEKRFLRGEFYGYGPIHAAVVTNRGRAVRVVRYTDANERSTFFHPDGRSVRKMFLRCPLPFMRVTSGYGNRRHPVLGFSARHNGIDLGAPRGTPVKATATGVVTHAGSHRTKGRYVQLRHPNSYATHYYHLSGIRRGIQRGRRVTQGEVIGYVGNTGLSTGPHLHYGIRHNNRFINPMRLRPPSKNPVPPAEMVSFQRHCNQVFFSMTAFSWLQANKVDHWIPASFETVADDAATPLSEAPSIPLSFPEDLEIHP